MSLAEPKRILIGRGPSGPPSLAELQHRLADLQRVARVDLRGARDALLVEIRPVRRAEILDEPGAVPGKEPRVAGGDVGVVEPDLRGLGTPDLERLGELVRAELLPVGGADEHARGHARAAVRRTWWPRLRLLARLLGLAPSAEVERHDGAEGPVDEEVQQDEERVLQDREDERRDGHAVRKSMTVRPIVMRSPSSRGCSRIRWPFTVVPFVEPRSTSS